MWTAKTDLFENADVKTVELTRAQIMCACSSVHLNVAGEAAFIAYGETAGLKKV